MKAIILAAGKGTRISRLTKDKPKGLLDFFGKTILQRQIELFRECNVNDISIVTGYQGKHIKFDGIKTYKNSNFETTNMVESLFSAKNEFDDDIIVSYSDILFSKLFLMNLINSNNQICVSVDSKWKDYWLKRYGNLTEDLETLEISNEGKITNIGFKSQNINNLKFRYVGLNKFSRKILKSITVIYEDKKNKNEEWRASKKKFYEGYMTDLIQEIIDNKIDVHPVINEKNWVEIDTEEDYHLALEMYKNKDFKITNRND